MSAPEPTTVAPVEEVKPTDAMPAVETPKVEEPPAVVEVVDPVVDASPVTDAEPAAEPAATEEPPKVEAKPEAGPKGIFSKFFGTVKGKVSKPKSPKKEKKKLEAETPAAGEAMKEVVPEAPAVEVTEPEPPKEVMEVTEEPPKETEAPVPAAVPEEAEDKPAPKEDMMPKDMVPKAVKVGRRLSARVGDFFKSKSKPELTTPPKVDEAPPMIDAHLPVPPLEDPASEVVPEAKVEESVKPAEVTTPVIAATA